MWLGAVISFLQSLNVSKNVTPRSARSDQQARTKVKQRLYPNKMTCAIAHTLAGFGVQE